MTPAYETHALVTAATAAQVGWSTALALASGGETWRDGGALCVRSLKPRHEAVILFPPRPDGSALDRTLERCSERGVPRVGCWSSGLGDDERLDEVLKARRFEDGWQPHWMFRDLARATPPLDPRVEIGEDSELHSWRIAARDGDEEAGRAWLHVPDMAPHVGGLFELFVEERARRRGLGTALANAAFVKALELGCSHVVVTALGPGEPLFGVLGFHSLGRGRTWWLDLAR
jgi:GNAT superfamily N-acetyltransferase